MCRLWSVSGTGSLSVRSMQLQKPTVAHPLDGIRNNRTLRWAVETLPAVYLMEGSAIGAKGVHSFIIIKGGGGRGFAQTSGRRNKRFQPVGNRLKKSQK